MITFGPSGLFRGKLNGNEVKNKNYPLRYFLILLPLPYPILVLVFVKSKA